MSGVIGVAFVQASTAGELLNAGVEHAGQESVLEALMKVAYRPELGLDPTFVHAVLILFENRERKVALRHRIVSGLCGKHPALDGKVNTL